MLFKISVVVCLNILIVLIYAILKAITKVQRKKFIDKLRDYGARRN